MNKLDKYFEKWEPETECIVVGCSPSLRWYDFGKYIDKFKTVVRINKCFDDGYFKNTGKKIDVWSTTDNTRWDCFNPVTHTTKEVWTRNESAIQDLKNNGTLKNFAKDNFHGPVIAMGRNHFNNFGLPGLGTGLITLNHAIQKYGKITIIGHTFYLESTDGKCYDFNNKEEDAEHKKNRLDHHYGDTYGLKSLKYVLDWINDGKILLLNPWEYNNLRGIEYENGDK